MVQIDGSPHEWFEKRRSSCNLTVYVDDATGEFMELWFSEAETTEAYMVTTLNYLVEYGLPRAFYSDKHSIFRVNQKDTVSGTELTQFGRALKTLGIELISAQTPQAKGRVERANKLLQDRLVKELRLQKINTIAEANDFLVEYKDELNKKFSVTARSPENGHRKVLHSPEELKRIFSLHHERTLSKNLSLQYDNTIYQIQTEGRGLTMRNAKVTVCEDFKGSVNILYKGRELTYTTYKRAEKQEQSENAKTINHRVDMAIEKQNKKSNRKNKIDELWRVHVTDILNQEQPENRTFLFCTE